MELAVEWDQCQRYPFPPVCPIEVVSTHADRRVYGATHVAQIRNPGTEISRHRSFFFGGERPGWGSEIDMETKGTVSELDL